MEFGKFKDATSLFEAYKNLEKVFTKKCQEVSELTKQLEVERYETIAQRQIADETINSENEKSDLSNAGNDLVAELGEALRVVSQEMSGGEMVEDDFQKGEKLDSCSAFEVGFESEENAPCVESGQSFLETKNSDGESLSRFKSSEWRKEVSKFLALCPEAKEYRADMARLIMGSSLLRDDPDCLNKAFQIAKNNRPASNEKSLQREKPYELENLKSEAPIKENGVGDDALNMTVADLLKKVADTPKLSPRFVRAGMSAGAIGITTPRTIKSLSEAKDYLLKNYFK